MGEVLGLYAGATTEAMPVHFHAGGKRKNNSAIERISSQEMVTSEFCRQRQRRYANVVAKDGRRGDNPT